MKTKTDLVKGLARKDVPIGKTVKLPAHRAGLLDIDLLFRIVPLPACHQAGNPAIPLGLSGHAPVKARKWQ